MDTVATQRNIDAIRALYEPYKTAWQTHRMPKPPRGLLVWAPGASADNSGKHTFDIEAHDFADDPFFLDIEAQFFWQGIPDFRVTDLDISGADDFVLSICMYEGTDRAGKALPVVWTADRWRFDAEGRIVHWQQVTDLSTWHEWQVAVPGADYATYITQAYASAGAPVRFYP